MLLLWINRSYCFQPVCRALFVHGLTSNQVWLLAGIAAWIFGSLSDRIDDWFSDSVVIQLDRIAYRFAVADAGRHDSCSVWDSLMLLSGVLAIVRFYDFRLFRSRRSPGQRGWLAG